MAMRAATNEVREGIKKREALHGHNLTPERKRWRESYRPGGGRFPGGHFTPINS